MHPAKTTDIAPDDRSCPGDLRFEPEIAMTPGATLAGGNAIVPVRVHLVRGGSRIVEHATTRRSGSHCRGMWLEGAIECATRGINCRRGRDPRDADSSWARRRFYGDDDGRKVRQ